MTNEDYESWTVREFLEHELGAVRELYKENPDEMLENVILAAIQEAQKKASQEKESSMSALTGGMKLPGLM